MDNTNKNKKLFIKLVTKPVYCRNENKFYDGCFIKLVITKITNKLKPDVKSELTFCVLNGNQFR